MTKAPTKRAAKQNDLRPSYDDLAFLRQTIKIAHGQTMTVVKVGKSNYRVNIRSSVETGFAGLVMRPIVQSKFVSIDRLNDGSPKLRFAYRSARSFSHAITGLGCSISCWTNYSSRWRRW